MTEDNPSIQSTNDKRWVEWPEPGRDETRLAVCDRTMFTESPWLREGKFDGNARDVRGYFGNSNRRVAAYTHVLRRNGSTVGSLRVWHLHPYDRFDRICPFEAVVPQTISVNGQSEPYFLAHEPLSYEEAKTKRYHTDPWTDLVEEWIVGRDVVTAGDVLRALGRTGHGCRQERRLINVLNFLGYQWDYSRAGDVYRRTRHCGDVSAA